jgi:hypothetical protein
MVTYWEASKSGAKNPKHFSIAAASLICAVLGGPLGFLAICFFIVYFICTGFDVKKTLKVFDD